MTKTTQIERNRQATELREIAAAHCEMAQDSIEAGEPGYALEMQHTANYLILIAGELEAGNDHRYVLTAAGRHTDMPAMRGEIEALLEDIGVVSVN